MANKRTKEQIAEDFRVGKIDAEEMMRQTAEKTKEQIAEDFRVGKIDAEEMMRQMKEADRKPPRFAVAEKSGWLSIYFDGLRFPVSMPYECASVLFSDEQVAQARSYLEANKSRFKVKNKGS